MQNYVRLNDRVIFKSRYNRWYFIDTSDMGRERIMVEEGADDLLLSLFAGLSKQQACDDYQLSKQELETFISYLTAEGMLIETQEPTNSLERCHDMEPPLDSLNLLITNACNLHCQHCYVSSGKPLPDELDANSWIAILKQARQLGVFGINVSGGEATLHRGFKQIANYIASVPTFNANLNTNAFVMEPGLEDVIARAFKTVQVSLDDVEPSKHDIFRGRSGCFQKSLENIARLRSAGVETNVGFSLTHMNLQALDGLVELCEELGVNILNIGFVGNMGRASDNGLVQLVSQDSIHTDGFMEQMYQKMRQLAERQSKVKILLPFRVYSDKPTVPREKHYICDGDNLQIAYIMANGTVMPCDKLPTSSFGYGNVGRNTLTEIWQSDQMQAFKLMGPKQLPKCRNCPHLKVCGGACVARAYQTGGSLDSPDWTSCTIAQKFMQEKQQTTKQGGLL